MKRKSLLLLWLLAMMLAPRWGFAQDITLNQSQSIALTPGTTRNFYDSGGSSSNYSNSESYTLTLTNAGNITINFSSFTTESSSGCNDWDYMYIYDGSTSGTQLAKGQTGCSSANLTTGTNYTATSGTMTITWHSDGSNTAAGWVATITAASVPGLVPFVDGLESSTWYLVNGSCTNKWYLGTPGARYGTAGLYISNDSGTTNAYSTGSTSVVYAYKEVTFPSAGKYNLSFDIKQYGESTWDCVGAMLYDNNTSPSASTTSAGSGLTSFPSGYTTMITGVGYSFSGGAWKTSSTDFTVTTAGKYKLTFCWKNDSGGGTQPPAAIDNVILTKVNDVTAVTSPDGTGSMTTSLTWGFEDGSYQGWTVINNDSDAYTWMISSEFPGYSTHSSATSISNESHNGPGSVISGSYINGIGAFTNVDNYLVSPRLILGGSISFYAKSVQGEYPEQFGVAVCTSDNPTASNFTTIQTWTGASDTDWHLYTVDLSAYTDYGYVAIRNYGTTDQYLMIVDDITLTSRSVSNFNRPLASGVSATFNVTPNSGVSFSKWTKNNATVSTSTSYTFTVEEPSALVAVMDVPATVPYTHNFEDAAENGQWSLVNNGSYPNQWIIGGDTYSSASTSLYISDNGSTNTYNNGSSSYVYASRKINFTEAGDYVVSFKWKARGENGCWDAMYAALCPPNGTFPPSNITGSTNSLPSGYINVGDVSQSNNTSGVFLWTYNESGWITSRQTVTISTTGTYTLVFYWKNDGGGGSNPPAAVDDVSVKKLPTFYNVAASANPNSAGNVKFLVGDGGTTTNTYLPCYTLYNYNLTQQIYTPLEIGNVGTINSIAFYNGGDTKTLTDLEFYMVHTFKDEFGNSSDWIPVTSSNLVFSGSNVEMTAGQWTIINLTTPFVYDGLSNLAIVTREHMQYDSGLACRVFTPASGGNCSIYAYNDNNAYDVTSPSQYSGTRLTVKNQIMVNPGGSLTRSFPQGATVTLVEELTNSDYHFENWTDNSSNVGNNEIYTISNIAAAHTVVANFAPNTHTLNASVSPANSGTISDGNNNISGATTYNHGTSVTLTANAATGYTFQNWTIDGSTVSDASTTITMDQDHNVVANFTLNTYTVQVSASPSNGGTVSGGGTYNYGASCTVIATHATNYVFDNWTENGSIVMDNGSPAGASYSFTVNGDRTLVANFHLDAVNITATAYDDSNNTTGGGTISGTGAIAIGSTCTLVATPGTGYEFVRWTENGSEVSTNATYSFTVSVARTLVAHFRLMDYTLTLAANPQAGGTVSANPAGPYHYNDVVTISATAATGYTFTSWSDNGTQSHTVTITGSASYTANFSLNQHTVTYAYTGTVPTGAPAVPAQATYYYGDAVPAAAVPTLTGYTFSGWVGEVSTMPDNDVTVTGSWTAIDYTLTLVADPVGGGTVSASPAGPYHYNDVVTVTATPNSGFIFGAWSDGGAQTHTITITDNTELTAYFGADQTLTTYVNPIEGGYVTIAENQVSTIGAVEVGDASASGVQNVSSPYWTSTSYSFEECLYLASEIGVADAYITSISYYVRSSSSASSQTDDRIEVYMKNTNRTSFSSSNSDMEAVTANDKVFDGTWHLTNTTGWVTIVLDKPFHYTGSSLMIGINEMTQGASNINFKFTNTATLMGGGYSCRSRYSDTPLDPTSLTSLLTKINDRANVRLGFGTYHYGQSVTLTAHANEGYQFVNWTENSTELGTNDTYTVTMNADHTIYANFARLAKRFVTNGSWDNGNNWSPTGAPDITEDVSIEAAATIPSGVVATANEITINGGSITIQDGGQLVHNNAASSMVTVTAENTIASYDDGGDNIHNKGYEIVSFPVDNLTVNSSAITGLVTSDPYDFYRFDASNDPLEWIPMTSNNSISLLQGFIYASQDGTTIRVTGPVMSSENDVNGTAVDFLNANAPRFNGWALLGNPFVCNAYVSLGTGNGAGSETNFYKLNHTATYDEFVPFTNSDAVNPMGGVMFRVFNNDNIVYSRTASSGAKTGILNMDVTCVKDRATVTLDRARVRFGEGRNLEKLQFDTRHTKVYIPEGGNDFSVYYADGAGTIPVNFKAQDNGRYTLDFSTEDVGFNYLHLIDNMNGNDVDLLQTPYYAFDAKSTDFASRFTLVFATGNDNDDTFAFFNNGVWIINNDGEATLQVVDALGRMLSSESISGSTSKAINVAPGVYMLRLINGDKVKVQKIVVKR